MEHLFLGFFDTHFHYFSLLVATLLVILGAFLLVLKNYKNTKEASNKIWVAYKPWFIMAPMCLLSVGLGGQILICSFFLLSFFSIREFSRATGLHTDTAFMFALYAGNVLLYFAVAMNWKTLFASMPTLLFAIFLVIPPIRDEYKQMLPKVGLTLISILYLAWFPAHLALLAHHPRGYIYLIFLLIGTELNDASAYLCGKLFGKRLLIPKISPRKTIEGALGAFIIVSLYAWFVHSWVPGFNLPLSAMSVLLMTVGGTLGDLIMSFFKRDIGIKDMGNLIPGHGGLLDRVDSLLLISPFYFYLILYLVPLIGEAI